MKKIFWTLIIVFMAAQAVQAQNWQPVSANVSFTLKMLGVKVVGNFKGLAGNIKFDPNSLETSSIFATVEAATVDTDNSLRNRHMREKEDFFEVAKYPKITMKSTKIEKTDKGYVGYFDLTIKKVTKSVKLPFGVVQTADKAVFSGSTTINRRDWGIGGSTFGMSNDVTLSLLVNTVQK
jgi:polyisoprenoid-binding protein YceI